MGHQHCSQALHSRLYMAFPCLFHFMCRREEEFKGDATSTVMNERYTQVGISISIRTKSERLACRRRRTRSFHQASSPSSPRTSRHSKNLLHRSLPALATSRYQIPSQSQLSTRTKSIPAFLIYSPRLRCSSLTHPFPLPASIAAGNSANA